MTTSDYLVSFIGTGDVLVATAFVSYLHHSSIFNGDSFYEK